MFAKLFETKHGQILVKLDRHSEEDHPEVRIYFEPPNLGVCSAAIGFHDTEDGWNSAEKMFEKCDQAKAEGIVEEQLKVLSESVDE